MVVKKVPCFTDSYTQDIIAERSKTSAEASYACKLLSLLPVGPGLVDENCLSWSAVLVHRREPGHSLEVVEIHVRADVPDEECQR